MQPKEQATQSTPEDDTANPTDTPSGDLQQIWKKITESLADDGPRINAAVKQANPQKTGENTIQIQVSAEAQKELYAKFESKIIKVLRKELNNESLDIEFKMVENASDANRPLSNAEKYKQMSEENPALELLRRKFNLDIKK